MDLRGIPARIRDFYMPLAVIGDAPVDGVKAAKTTNMTNANSDVTLTARAYGAAGNSITVTYVDPGENDATLAVTVEGADQKDIVVSLATDNAGAITSTANAVKTAIEANARATALVAVTVEGTGAGVVNAVAEAALTGGVDVTAGKIGSMRVLTAGTTGYVKVSEQVWRKFTLAAL